MKKFIIKVLFFLLPIISIIGVYEYLMLNLGETYTMSSVLQLQDDNKSLFMRKYLSQEFNAYKICGIKRNQPEVLVVGSSRVMQFKGEYFKDKFYNAGGLIQNHKDLNEFLTNKINADFIILGIDSWWYKEDNIDNAYTWIDYDIEEKALSKSRYKSIIKIYNLFLDYFSPRISNNIGANAQLKNGGFRIDGSMKIPDERINLLLKENRFIDTEEPPVFKRIQEGLTSRFSISKIDTLEFLKSVNLIKSLAEQGKEIVVYLPPFSTESYNLFESTPAQNNFYQFTKNFIPEALSELDINFIATESSNDYNLDDTYFIDGFHPSEIFVAMQVNKHNDLFNQRIDTTLLRNAINDRYCNLLFNLNEMNTNAQQSVKRQ